MSITLYADDIRSIFGEIKMKKFVVPLTALLALPIWAKPITNWDHATDIAVKTFQKYHDRLTSLSIECVSFYERGESKLAFEVDVHEKHNDKCGGDPETAPRLFTLEINKKNGAVRTDIPPDHDYTHYGEKMYPIHQIQKRLP